MAMAVWKLALLLGLMSFTASAVEVGTNVTAKAQGSWPWPKHCSARGGCTCNCWWASKGCGNDDGSCCWGCCCGGPSPGPSPPPPPSPPSPSPPPPGPSPPPPPPSPSAKGAYCPQKNDLIIDYSSGGVSLNNNGWGIKGGGRVSSKTAFNLLGGFIEFDMDLSAAHSGVNQNLYVVSLNRPNCGSGCYCDAPNGGCMELDFVEANGHCAYATTWHTTMVGGRSCNVGGCQHVGGASGHMHVKATFSDDGWMTVFVNDQKVDAGAVNPHPSAQDASALKARMQSHGVVIESSQWRGWVPQGSCGGDYNLGASYFAIQNLHVKGTVVNGPEPSKCSWGNETKTITLV